MKKVYVLVGEQYLCDGVYDDKEITRGSLKHCENFKMRNIIGGEYRSVTIYEEGNDETD